MVLDMSIPIPSMLFGLGGKCVLNWALVLVQKDHIWRSFVCVFSLSVAAVDTALTAAATFIHLQSDSNVLGWRVTTYHLCLLVQILGYVYSAQHFAVLAITTLEHLYVILQRYRHNAWKPTPMVRLFLTVLTWSVSTFYVFKLSNVQPYLEDAAYFEINHCWASSSSVISDLTTYFACLCLCGTLWHSLKYLTQLARSPTLNPPNTLKSQVKSSFLFITKVARVLCDTWAFFLICMLVFAVLPVTMPSHLGLNCAWLCFSNSLLVAAALCVASPAQGLAAVPPDSFCDWRTQFSLETDLRHLLHERERR